MSNPSNNSGNRIDLSEGSLTSRSGKAGESVVLALDAATVEALGGRLAMRRYKIKDREVVGSKHHRRRVPASWRVPTAILTGKGLVPKTGRDFKGMRKVVTLDGTVALPAEYMWFRPGDHFMTREAKRRCAAANVRCVEEVPVGEKWESVVAYWVPDSILHETERATLERRS